MHDAPPILIALEKLVSHWLHVVGNGIEVFGVFVIVIGIGWSTYLYLKRRTGVQVYDAYKSGSADLFCSGSKCSWQPIS
jgi:hypothetical protein